MTGLEQDRQLIRGLAEFYKLTPAALAREVDVAVTTVNRPYSGKATSRLSQPTLDKLRNRFPDFPGWAEYLSGDQLSDKRLPFHGAPLDHAVDAELVELDEIDLRYGLGGTYVDGPVSVERRTFSRSWLRLFTRAAPEHLFWTTGDGDSMEPTIRSGEVILIDTSQKTPRMAEGIWAVAWGDVGMIKRLRPRPDGMVEVHSDNPVIGPMIAADDELHVIGRVVAVVRRF